MTTWPADDLARYGDAQEVRVAGMRRDGTLRAPVIVWVVRVGRRALHPFGERAGSRMVSGRPGPTPRAARPQAMPRPTSISSTEAIPLTTT